MDTLDTLHTRRLANWRQTPETRIAGPDDAIPLIERLGLVTLYPVSPELPNLFSAFVGDPDSPLTPTGTAPPARSTRGAGRSAAAMWASTPPSCASVPPG